jgi:hypothetical protein
VIASADPRFLVRRAQDGFDFRSGDKFCRLILSVTSKSVRARRRGGGRPRYRLPKPVFEYRPFNDNTPTDAAAILRSF